MVEKIKKEYISRRDLRTRGFTQKDAVFNVLHEQINRRAAEKVERELYSEIQANHGEEMLIEYGRRVEEDGFLDSATQAWLIMYVPALPQMEAEWREILIAELLSSEETSK